MGEFEWPWEYSFPPFFTIQPNAQTHEIQLKTWSDLLIKYYKHNRKCYLNVNDNDNVLFSNESINRKLPVDGRIAVLEYLQRNGNAAPVNKKMKTEWEIYWLPLDELALAIYNWAAANGMTNTVCTLFELVNGDNSIGEEFHGLDEGVLVKALRTLEVKQKCELFDDNSGVKFF